MSRPRSRSPIRQFRNGADRSYSSSLSQDTQVLDSRSSANPSRPGGGRPYQRMKLSEEYERDSWRRARSPHHWHDPGSPRFSPPVEVGGRRGHFDPTPQLGYAEWRRLSPQERYHSPHGGSSWRPSPHGDLQRFQEGRKPSCPQRFSQGDSTASRYESSTQKMVPSPEWDRAPRNTDLEPIPDQACQKSPRHYLRPKQGRSEWLEARDVPGRGVEDREAFGFSEVHRRSPYLERCTEEPWIKCSSETRLDALWAQRGSAEQSPLIVEHDHGLEKRGKCREMSGEQRAPNRDRSRDYDRDCMHSREEHLDRYQRTGIQSHQDVPNLRQNTASAERSLGKRSPTLSRGRQWEAPPVSSRSHYSPEFREQQEWDSNGDVDLRRIEPMEPVKMGEPRRPSVGPGNQRSRKAKQKRNFRQGESRFPGTAAAPEGPPQETLTIKVDMQRPADHNRPSCFSPDRQLSLDLVNVGRQRLDFLPLLEHSGTSQETALHSGTFAQEIITLVHQVKEIYFKGEGFTLNERFSGLNSSQAEEEEEAQSSPWPQRRIDLPQLEFQTQPALGPAVLMQKRRRQLADNPGDLRHDLERRRQERLESVKITIPGGVFPQHSQTAGGAVSDLGDADELGSDHNWPEEEEERAAERWSREMGSLGPRRPGFTQEDVGPLRQASRPQKRRGQRRQPTWSSSGRPGAEW